MTVTSKFGPHTLNGSAEALALVAAGAPVAKLVNDFGMAAEMLRLNPDVILIGRQISVYADQDGRVVTAENLRHLDPLVAAQLFIDIQKETYRRNPLILRWEGLNEPSWEVKNTDGTINIAATVANYEWYGRFEERRIELLAEMGLMAVILNFSYGTPDIDDGKLYAWLPLLPALQSAKIHRGLMGLHEYSFKNGMRDAWEANLGEGWLFGRYRKVHRLVLVPNDVEIPIVLTEFGSDFRRMPEMDYVNELKWADSVMRENEYLLGATIYTYGTAGDPAWDNFNLVGRPEAEAIRLYVLNSPPIDTGDDIPPQETPMTIINPSFENGWTDIGPEQQQPNGWTLTQTPPGQLMSVATKRSGGNHVDAFADAKQEVVHKLSTQLPENERLGQRRALILHGDTNLKLFWGLASESKLSTVITGTPGKRVRVRVPILGESNLTGPLEDDTFWVAVALGMDVDRANYFGMSNEIGIVGNERHWNIFTVEGTFPADGRLTLTITLQDNWGRTDFFIDNITLEELTNGNGTPTPTGSLLTLANDLVDAAHALTVRLQDVAEGVEMIEAGARQVAEALGASETP